MYSHDVDYIYDRGQQLHINCVNVLVGSAIEGDCHFHHVEGCQAAVQYMHIFRRNYASRDCPQSQLIVREEDYFSLTTRSHLYIRMN